MRFIEIKQKNAGNFTQVEQLAKTTHYYLQQITTDQQISYNHVRSPLRRLARNIGL
jgi:hypothetical protein